MKYKIMEAGASRDNDDFRVEPNRPAYLWDSKLKKAAAEVGKSIERAEEERDGRNKR